MVLCPLGWHLHLVVVVAQSWDVANKVWYGVDEESVSPTLNGGFWSRATLACLCAVRPCACLYVCMSVT